MQQENGSPKVLVRAGTVRGAAFELRWDPMGVLERPGAEEAIKYKIPAFTLKGNLIYFAAHQNHVGIYPVPKGTKEFQKEIAGYRGGKGTKRFPLGEPVPLDLLRKIVEFRVKENLENADAKRR